MLHAYFVQPRNNAQYSANTPYSEVFYSQVLIFLCVFNDYSSNLFQQLEVFFMLRAHFPLKTSATTNNTQYPADTSY